MTRLILLLGLLLISNMASAEIYKWIDKNGEVHYQDHPRGSQQIFSAAKTSAKKSTKSLQKNVKQKSATAKLLKDMEKSRKQREKVRKAQLAKERKQAEKCINYRFKTDKLAANMKKKYSQFSNDRPPEYTQLQKQLERRKQYLETYCN